MSAPLAAAGELDLELKRLLVGTNDQRRRVGQTLFHFYRTLVFWKEKGLSFFEATKAWAASGAAIFDSMAYTLSELGEPEADVELRTFTVGFLQQLADDLEGGDHLLMPFLRTIEGRFPALTKMMQAEDEANRIYDVEFAQVMARMFAWGARGTREELIGILREARHALATEA